VVVPFPFSDLSRSKRRPAPVLAEQGGDDLLLCQITSRRISDQHAVRIDDEDFETGSLHRSSSRPNRIFTADRNIVLYRVGHLRPNKFDEVIYELTAILRP